MYEHLKGGEVIKKFWILILILICAGFWVNGMIYKSPYNMIHNISKDQIMVVQVFARENGTYISSVLPRDTLDEVFRLLSNVERSDVKRTWSSMENTATPERGIYIKLQNGSEILLKSTDKAGQYAIQFDWDTSRNYKGRYRVVLPDAQNFIEQQIAGGNMT